MNPFHDGDALNARLPSFQRPLLVLAHHDDEISTAGLLQRLAPRVRVAWTTNSDGLYYETKLTPPDYSKLRVAEGFASMAIAGVPVDHVTNLGFSEVEIYRRLAWLHAGEKTMEDVRPFFDELRVAVRDAVFAAQPDIVFTQAWQGGQPEHDLTHFFTMLAVRDLRSETGRDIPLYHLPVYEYTVAIAFRFHPLYRGPRLRLRLTPAELATKLRLADAYATQAPGFTMFKRIAGGALWLGRPFGGPRNLEELFGVEELGPVPDDLDYARKPHRFDFFTYMFDDFEGTKVTFCGSIRPIVCAFWTPG